MSSLKRWLNQREEGLWDRFKRCEVTEMEDILLSSPIGLMEKLDFSYEKIKELKSLVSSKIVTNCSKGTALDLYLTENRQEGEKHSSLFRNSSKFFSTGEKNLDYSLRGGVRAGSIIEICGPPSVGKTQLCLGICATVILREAENSNGVLYFDTELKFDVKRLHEILVSMINGSEHEIELDMLLSRIQIKRPSSCQQMNAEVDNLEDYIISNRISLIVIDSMAALPRKENLTQGELEGFLLRQIQKLRRIAESCGCVLLVTNQILPMAPSRDLGTSDMIIDSKGFYKAALGIVWYHCVTCRIVMATTTEENVHPTLHTNRLLSIVKCPWSPNCSMNYDITPKGIAVTSMGSKGL